MKTRVLSSSALVAQQNLSRHSANLEQGADGASHHQSRSRTWLNRAYPPSRILIHAINYAPELIGCAKYSTELAEFLSERGHQVEVVTAPPHYPGWHVRQPYRAFAYQREVVGAIRITRCPMLMKKNGGGLWRLLAPLTFALSAAPAVLWRILRARPDVVLCVEPTLFSSPVAVFGANSSARASFSMCRTSRSTPLSTSGISRARELDNSPIYWNAGCSKASITS